MSKEYQSQTPRFFRGLRWKDKRQFADEKGIDFIIKLMDEIIQEMRHSRADKRSEQGEILEFCLIYLQDKIANQKNDDN